MRIIKKLTPAACLILTSCAMVGPDYKEPKTSVLDHWISQDSIVKSTPYTNRIWWKSFNDPVLTQLIQQGYENNLSLQSAGVRVLQARAQLAQSVGNLYPQQQVGMGNLNYYRTGGGSLQGLVPSVFETALLGFSANWEIDFWGKYRRAIQSNDATFLASIAAYDNALVTLTADIATIYINIRTTEVQIKITKANIAVQSVGLKIARARYTAGQTSLVDVEQAQTELLQTESNLPGFQANLQRQKDALTLLLGTIPGQADHLLKSKQGIPNAPKSIGVGIPKEALARRPDVYQARLQAVAQSETIGAIKANLYPALSLTGTFAFAANTINGSSLSDVFQWSNRNINMGAGFNWPLLNYGQITNAVRTQDAAFQQSMLSYMNLVLKAQQEVQDNITGFIEAKKAVGILTKADRSATESLRLAIIRYREGETDFTPVLNAEQQQLRVQTSLINAEGDVPSQLVALYRALGGGWEMRCGKDIVPEEMKKEMAARTNWGSLLMKKNHMVPKTKGQKFDELYLPKW